MFSLILIIIICVALVAALALATLHYGRCLRAERMLDEKVKRLIDERVNSPEFAQLKTQQLQEITLVRNTFDYSVFAGARGMLSGSTFKAHR